MIKRYLKIILFLSLSLFLVLPVSAADNFEKIIDVVTEELDYRNSLIDWYGYNIELQFFWDKRGGGSPTGAGVGLYIGGVETLGSEVWEYNEVEEMYELVLSSADMQTIKTIIFSRSYVSNSRLFFYAKPQEAYYFFELRLSFKSLLNVNLSSIYVVDTYYDANNYMTDWYKTVAIRTKNDDLVSIGVLDDYSTQLELSNQLALYNLVDKYTNVKQIYFSYVMSKGTSPTDETIYTFINQIGLFADNQVILPDLNIDTDFQIYAPTICGILDLACVSRNLIGEFSNNIYNQLGAETIAGGVMDIYDTLFYPVYIIDDTGWQNGILSLYAMMLVGVLYLIVKRVIA